MDLWQLRTLSVVAKTLNFTRASEELNLSQPAVSHQIRALEKEIGRQLFERTVNGVTLTASGKSAFEHAQRILDIADELKADLDERTEGLAAQLVLGGSFRGLANPFHTIYIGFKEKYGEIDVTFQGEQSPGDIVRKVKEGSIDLGLVADEFLVPELDSIPYGEYHLQLVVGKDHPFAKRKGVRPDELVNEKWVLFEPQSRFRMYVEECFEAAGFVPKKVFETNDGALIRSMVANGETVSCLPSWGFSQQAGPGGIVAVEVEGWSRSIQLSLVWNRARLSKALRHMIVYLLETEIEGVDLFRMKFVAANTS